MATESLAELVRFAPDVDGFRYVHHVALFIVTAGGAILVDPILSGHATPQMSGTKQDVVEQRRYHEDLADAIATARAVGHADASPETTTPVRSLLHPRSGACRRFDEFLPLNIRGMIAWRAGQSPSAH